MYSTTEQDPTQGAPLGAWRANLQSRSTARGPLHVPDALNKRDGPQAREASKCPNWQSYAERLAKEAFWSPATTGSKKAPERATSPAVEASVSLHTWRRQGPHKPSSCATFTLNPHWGRAATGKQSLAPVCTGSPGSCLTLCDPVTVACQASLSGRGFSRQEDWSILANTGCHALLGHCISCCPGRQLPWVPGAARTPETQAAAAPPHQALTGANPSPPGQPQEQTPVDDPRAEVEIKPQLKPRGRVAKEEDPKPSPQLCRLQVKSTGSARQAPPGERVRGHWERHERKRTSSESRGHWRRGHRGAGPD